jgi:hypothetical protein
MHGSARLLGICVVRDIAAGRRSVERSREIQPIRLTTRLYDAGGFVTVPHGLNLFLTEPRSAKTDTTFKKILEEDW